MFKCKVCAEKDRRIEDLKSVIRMLQPSNSSAIPLVHLEANKVLDGNDEIIDLAKEDPDAKDVLSERDRLMSGNY